MADGSIRIETKLDNSALRQQIKELERELKNIQKEQAKTEAQANQIRSKYDAERELDSQMPEEFSHREDIDKRAAQELDPTIAKQEELNQKKRETLALLDAAKAKEAELANIASTVKQVDNDIKGDAAFAKVQTQEQYNSLLEQTRAKMAAIEASAARWAAQNGLSKEQILAAHPQYQKLSDTMGMLKARASDFGNEAKTAGKKASSAMKQAEKGVDKVGKATKRGIAGFGRMQLTMMAVMFAMRAISSATQEYIAVNTKLEGQLNTLKALWGQVLGPVIQWVINLLIQAIGAVNGFVYALTGINFVARANAAALKKQAKATSSAAKAAQLAGFDEQTKLADTSGSGGASNNPVELLDATVGALSGFAEKLKNQILAGDWFGDGQTVGQWLMDGIESIDWYGVGTTIGEFMWGAVAFMFGFALSLDAETLLTAANNLLTGFFNAMLAGIQSFDWFTIGQGLVDFLLDAIVIALAMSNIALAILALILSPGGEEMARSASEFIGSLVGALASALVGMGERIGEIGKNLFATIKTYFDEYVDWEGTPEEIINGLLNGIGAALMNIGTWIHDNIWVPFRDGFKKEFDIHSPSKKMEGFGDDIINGLFNGITRGINKITQACQQIWSAIKGVFSSVGTWFETKFSNAWQRVKDVFSKGGKIFDGIKEGIASTFKTIVNGLITGINKVISVPFNTINGLLNTIRSIEILEIKPFKGLWSKNPLAVPQIPKLARGGIVNNPGRGVPAIIGEAGAEAVLPLDGPNADAWMDVLAEKIGGNVTIPIYMDGKKIATYVVDIQKKKAFAMNGA